MIKAEKSTLSNLIQACQAKDSQEELFLGRGVLSADAQRKVKNEKRVKEMEMEPWNLTEFVGEMDKNESKRLLSNEPPGTYLIRLNQDKEYRLAVKTETGTINNFKINYENGKYNFLNWEESSLTDLITNIQRNHIQYMTPFVRKECNIPIISKSRASYVLSFNTQGSYLVRKNEEGKIRISYMKNDRMKNMIVGNEPESLRRVIEELKKDGSITNEIFDDLPPN
ncbi:uncharacterized protein LOC111713690 [Eurytemora carolleeae]|uniref:uncharacterized protein LOC111713690 n=1 Tax=Eurytemora carolleeae TaxID=1294199 RepID=UPI000C79335F|nr:uncharacterized protein LOC111713690 [Eurytemora carolleeae]|eukprot:XP_023344394.1 uncharacterized protein LOC111713690 [Eurytemora affinis]